MGCIAAVRVDCRCNCSINQWLAVFVLAGNGQLHFAARLHIRSATRDIAFIVHFDRDCAVQAYAFIAWSRRIISFACAQFVFSIDRLAVAVCGFRFNSQIAICKVWRYLGCIAAVRVDCRFNCSISQRLAVFVLAGNGQLHFAARLNVCRCTGDIAFIVHFNSD